MSDLTYFCSIMGKKSNAPRFLHSQALKWYEDCRTEKSFRGPNFIQKFGPSKKRRLYDNIFSSLQFAECFGHTARHDFRESVKLNERVFNIFSWHFWTRKFFPMEPGNFTRGHPSHLSQLEFFYNDFYNAKNERKICT